jgi:hypothetical protein
MGILSSLNEYWKPETGVDRVKMYMRNAFLAALLVGGIIEGCRVASQYETSFISDQTAAEVLNQLEGGELYLKN